MSAIHDLIEWALINGGKNDKELAKLAGVAVDKLEAELARSQAAIEAARGALENIRGDCERAALKHITAVVLREAGAALVELDTLVSGASAGKGKS